MKNFKNALFINFGGIGDEILFLPTIKSFKNANPDSKVTLALEPRSKSIKNLSNLIDEIICVDIKAQGFQKYLNILKFISSLWFKKFDIVISSGKSPFIALILFLSGIKERVGFESKTDKLLTKKVYLNENQYAAKMYHDLLKPLEIYSYADPELCFESEFELDSNLKKGEYIVLHPGVSKMSVSKNILKCPKLPFWLDLTKGLLKKGKQVVLLGTQDDAELIEAILKKDVISKNPNFINYFNKTKNIAHMAFIMKNAKSVICVDSAPLHVAIAMGCKTFAIFAPTNELKLVPKNQNVEIITNEVKCRPCLWHKRQTNCKYSKCLDVDYKLILDKIN